MVMTENIFQTFVKHFTCCQVIKNCLAFSDSHCYIGAGCKFFVFFSIFFCTIWQNRAPFVQMYKKSCFLPLYWDTPPMRRIFTDTMCDTKACIVARTLPSNKCYKYKSRTHGFHVKFLSPERCPSQAGHHTRWCLLVQSLVRKLEQYVMLPGDLNTYQL